MDTNRSFSRAALLAATAIAACTARTPARTSAQPLSPAEVAQADSGRPAYTPADVRFMSGMIGHHAQAVLMAGWAPGHGASQTVRALCERIVVGQRDEIAFMQSWLRDRHLPVPDGDPSQVMMPGMDHPMMPGMLTPQQLAQLDQARGGEFDRLFLTFMIQHHQGAITMVEQLMGAQGAAQDDKVFKFVSDVNTDQATEIERMGLMLAEMASKGKSP